MSSRNFPPSTGACFDVYQTMVGRRGRRRVSYAIGTLHAGLMAPTAPIDVMDTTGNHLSLVPIPRWRAAAISIKCS